MKRKILYSGLIIGASLWVAFLVGEQNKEYQNHSDLQEACSQEKILLTTGTKFNNAPSPEACAGKQFVDTKMGAYQLGQTIFRIPRAYLWQGRYKEGPNDTLYLSMYYPSLEPEKEDSNGLDSSLVRFDIHQCQLKECERAKTPDYDLRITIPREHSTYTKPTYIPELELFHYTITDHVREPIITEVYYSGKRNAPDYWLACITTNSNPLCNGGFWLKKDISISFSFSYSNLAKHKKITDKITEKVNQFTGGMQ